ncbi:antitoxin VbhA family protein [Acidiphilium acidophilum]|uniref:antitoxin VbhA family protein n=1 Tax=Acidiphilium acidophilum TaxID=76588 RepID=UPI002E8E7848|nr:antitoxin VbhA family protein [Acidiphilium acidophilum]
MDQIISETPKITEAERARRKEAIDFARGSVRLEGFILDEATERLNARYVAGEITRQELTREIVRMSGIDAV